MVNLSFMGLVFQMACHMGICSPTASRILSDKNPDDHSSTRLGVIGVGNSLMGDDGIGLALLERIGKHELPSNVKLIALGTGGMSIIHKLGELEAAIVVDAVDFNGVAGESRIFTPEETRNMNIRRPESLHECNLLEAIELTKALGWAPRELVIYGIQPEKIAFGDHLSVAVEARLDEMEEELHSLIREVSRRIGTS